MKHQTKSNKDIIEKTFSELFDLMIVLFVTVIYNIV